MRRLWILAISVTLAAGMAVPVQAQFLDRLLDRAERAVKGEVGAKVDRETRRLTRCVMGDARCIRMAEQRGEDVEIVRPNDGDAQSSEAAAATSSDARFPHGAISFADEVVSYVHGSDGALAIAYRGANNALGEPDAEGQADCRSQDSCPFVGLGSGGQIVLRFADNILAGSGDSTPDLWVFGSGPATDRVSIEISVDGQEWVRVGEVRSEQTGIDLDPFGFGRFTAFSYVRLANTADPGARDGSREYAVIDAVGAASTRPSR